MARGSNAESRVSHCLFNTLLRLTRWRRVALGERLHRCSTQLGFRLSDTRSGQDRRQLFLPQPITGSVSSVRGMWRRLIVATLTNPPSLQVGCDWGARTTRVVRAGASTATATGPPPSRQTPRQAANSQTTPAARAPSAAPAKVVTIYNVFKRPRMRRPNGRSGSGWRPARLAMASFDAAAAAASNLLRLTTEN